MILCVCSLFNTRAVERSRWCGGRFAWRGANVVALFRVFSDRCAVPSHFGYWLRFLTRVGRSPANLKRCRESAAEKEGRYKRKN